MRKLILSLATAFVVIGFTQSINSQDWDQWRGPGHQGLIPASYNSQSQNASDPACRIFPCRARFQMEQESSDRCKNGP